MTLGQENENSKLKSRITYLEGLLKSNVLSASVVTTKMDAHPCASSPLENSKRKLAEYKITQPRLGTQRMEGIGESPHMQPPPLKRSKTASSSQNSTRLAVTDNMSRSISSLPPKPRHFSTPHTLGVPFPGVSLPGIPLAVSMHPMSFPRTASQPSKPNWGYNARGVVAALDGVGVDPDQYIQLRACRNMVPNPSPYQCLVSHAMNPAFPSSCGSLTDDAATDTATNSQIGDSSCGSVAEPLEMVHVNSQDSFIAPSYPNQNFGTSLDLYGQVAFARPLDNVDVLCIGAGTEYPLMQQRSHHRSFQLCSNFAEESASAMKSSLSLNSKSSCSNTANEDPLVVSEHCVELKSQQSPAGMERSESNTSTRSASSHLSVRAKDTLRRQNSAARRISIQPRAAAPATEPANTQLHKVALLEGGSGSTIGGTSSLGKKEISKAKYARPKSAKLKCRHCDQYPKGFRGEHELRRHVHAKHTHEVKKWICCDPHELDIPTSIDVVQPLRDCKNCVAKKQYGAYYNAAAHLRRTHFKKKTPRKGSLQSSEVPSAEGGTSPDWPPMQDLKCWLKEVVVPVDPSNLAAEKDANGKDGAGSFPYKSCPENYSIPFENFLFDTGDPFSDDADTCVAIGGESASHFSPKLEDDMIAADMDAAFGHGPISSSTFYETQDTSPGFFNAGPSLYGNLSVTTTMTDGMPCFHPNYSMFANNTTESVNSTDILPFDFVSNALDRDNSCS